MRGSSPITLLVIAIALTTAPASIARAQSAPPEMPSPESVKYTLHVYTNLMQFATIVLGENLKPLPPIARERFSITLDGGPAFQPTKMRIENDDPLSLGILLDDSGPQGDIIRSFADALTQLPPQSLHAVDHITVYALDCRLIRSALDIPFAGADFKAYIDAALSHPSLHAGKPKPSCSRDFHLWDAIVKATDDLSQQNGRRVLLVVSPGNESGSKRHLDETLTFASFSGVAVFGFRNVEDYKAAHIGDANTIGSPTARGIGTNRVSPLSTTVQDDFTTLCQSSGGMVLDTSQRHLTKNLEDFLHLLRGRYILEYPRPNDARPVIHLLQVSVKGAAAFIRPTGGSAPLPDPALLSDPNTLPSAPSNIKVGNHPAMQPKS